MENLPTAVVFVFDPYPYTHGSLNELLDCHAYKVVGPRGPDEAARVAQAAVSATKRGPSKHLGAGSHGAPGWM